MKHPTRSGLLLAMALTLALGSAAGQSHSAAADALFREAVKLAEAGDFAKAVEKFKASYELERAPGTLLGLAMAEERMGRLASAVAHYRALAERAAALKDRKREKLAKDRISELEPKLGKVTLVANQALPDGAELEMDGEPLPLGAVGTALPADPGAHELRGHSPDGSKLEQRFELAPGQSAEVPLVWTKPKPVSAPPPVKRHAPAKSTEDAAQSTSQGSGLRTVGLVVAGAGVVLTGVGTYFWLKSSSTYDDLDKSCPDGHCPPSLRGRVDDGKQQENVGRIGIGVGLLAIATGAGIWVFGGKSAKTEESARVRGFVGPSSVGVNGWF